MTYTVCCLSEFCEFGDTQQDMIRDRLVYGINDSSIIQKRLLAEPKLPYKKAVELSLVELKLSYKKAVELSLSMEIAAKSMRELRVKQEGHVSQHRIQQGVHQVVNPRSHFGRGGTKAVLTAVPRGGTALRSAGLARM